MITHKLVGTTVQTAICQLQQGQTVYAEPGKFLWKTINVGLETRLTRPVGNQAGAPAAAAGLLQKALDVTKRALAGESLAFQYFTPAGGSGLVAFAGVIPGELRAIELDGTRGWLTEKATFVAAESSIDFDIAFTGLRAGLRGGEGFVLEHFSGVGTLLIAAAGSLTELNPAKYGGKIQVHTGCVVAFEDSLSYGIERVGGLNAQTMMTAAFGAEGINLATLEGDGRVLIQSVTLEALARSLHPYLPGSGEEKRGPLGGIL